MRFSVIIPAYNAAHMLDRCLQSILRQNYGDYQVLIVDDGSSDNTAAIAKRYADRDGRFSLIVTPHCSAGAARNAGLDYAQGQYVLHMDADDAWIREDLLTRLSEQIDREPADVYMYQMVKVTEEGKILNRYTKPPFQRNGTVQHLSQVYADLVRDGQTLASACNKCVRKDLLRGSRIRFREDLLSEDIDWVLQLFSYAQTICLLNLQAYAYTQHKGESRSCHPDGPNDLVTIICDWAQYLNDKAVAGFVAFEYGICMGNCYKLSREKKNILRENVHLLQYGLDKKTKLIGKFYRFFGFRLTCFAIRIYLFLRRIW